MWIGTGASVVRTGGGSSEAASFPVRPAATPLRTATEMTTRDADRLNVWVETMPRESLGLLWRWITLAYMARCDQRR